MPIVTIVLIICAEAFAEPTPVSRLIDSLGSSNNEVVDRTIKSLGIARGNSGGFKKFQVIWPWVGNSAGSFILTLSWDPPDGYILYMDHSGKILSRVKTGYVKSIGLQEKDRLVSSDLIIVDGRVGYGSGFAEDKFQIFSIDKNGLSKAWEAVSYLDDVYMQGKVINGAIKFERFSGQDTSYSLTYDATVESYNYNPITNQFSLDRTQRVSDTYVLIDGKFTLKGK